MRISMALFLGLYFLFQPIPNTHTYSGVSAAVVPPVIQDQDHFQPGPLRRGGSFRSPRSGYTPGAPGGRRPGATNPGNRAPAAPPGTRFGGGFLGGLFGGMLAGSLLGSLLNPLGFGNPGGVSVLGLLFWGVIIYLVVRFLRRRFGGGY